MNREPENAVWRDLTDPRRAEYLDDLEEGFSKRFSRWRRAFLQCF